MEDLRRGYSIAVFNSRGAHFVDPTGKPEFGLASQYGKRADEVENAGYQRVAAMLRAIRDVYEREGKAVVARHAADAVAGSHGSNGRQGNPLA
jgi:hypothetical protein